MLIQWRRLLYGGALLACYYKTDYSLYPDQSQFSDREPASNRLQNIINTKAATMGIRHPIKVYTKQERDAFVEGVNTAGSWNSMSMTLGGDRQSDPFCAAHELGHLKENHPLWKNLALLSIIHLLPFIPGYFALSLLSAHIILLERFLEKRADLTAAANVSVSEIYAFMRERKEYQQQRLLLTRLPGCSFFDRLNISSTGDKWLDFGTLIPIDNHPSDTRRMAYLSQYIDDNNLQEPTIQVFIDYQIQDMDLSHRIREMIKAHPKSTTFRTIREIHVNPEKDDANVTFYFFGSANPAVFDFDPEALEKPDLLPQVVETIMSSDVGFSCIIDAEDAEPQDLNNDKTKQNLGFSQDSQLHIMCVEANEPKEGMRKFLIREKRPLRLINTNNEFKFT
ncbi:hypothetical protein Lsha_0469 [Legionella shakespearei DSM 23087]|uniref:Peptidase M48 domain-containing protein n=2 Tax=Legionella shakespearei TaxID=45075 RepID=A0A0W0Z7K1_9GAMM|nr:hypothetical protein Lsha_0469 [Legionella shakespearei DSM 23087]